MPDVKFPKYIFGLHEPGGEYLMEEKGKVGWILFTHGLGHDPNDQNGQDYRQWSDRGFGIIARLNHGYGAAGTIPQPQHYDTFAQRVGNFVDNSHGCHIWIIGNEMNHEQERPDGQIVTPKQYAECYQKCWGQIHSILGRENDQVAIGAIAPWNNTTTYLGNEIGDWIHYFLDILQAIHNLGCPIDAITHHAYTHGSDPGLIFSEQKMDPPFQDYHFHFRCYQDFMHAIPQDLRDVPVYITETDEDEPWENANRGWVQNAYQEIDDWNNTPGNQQIRALILYRWPNYDKWVIETKSGVHDDFRAAMDHEYTWTLPGGNIPMPDESVLLNPNFENGFHLHGGVGELQLANDWQPWWNDGSVEGNQGKRPEYREERQAFGAGRVKEGTSAQKHFTTFSAQDAGIFQIIEDVTPGEWYEFNAWVWCWSSAQDDPNHSTDPGKMSALVGLNPWGDGRALYRTTIWGEEALEQYDKWVQVSVTAQAFSSRIAVFTRGIQVWAAKHGDFYWDQARLVKAFDEPTPTPPVPPTPPGDFTEIITAIRQMHIDGLEAHATAHRALADVLEQEAATLAG